jgi:Tol biopolymer transport system component
MGRPRAVLALAVAALAAAASTSPARAEESSAIYAVDLTSGRLAELVEDPRGEGVPIAPSWAEGGRSLVYARLPCDGCASEIRRAQLVPRGRSGLGAVIANGLAPSVSGADTVVFVGFDRALYAVDLHGGRRRRVLALGRGGTIDQPNVSRDGRLVVFVRHDVRGRGWLETVRIDGRERRRVTRTGPVANPAWSPDGRRLAFARQGAGGKWRICVMNADGTGVRTIGSPGASDSYPTWSPDGNRLAFVRELRFGHAIYVVRLDGSSLRRLTPPSLDAIEPAWAPGGNRIAFVVNGGD